MAVLLEDTEEGLKKFDTILSHFITSTEIRELCIKTIKDQKESPDVPLPLTVDRISEAYKMSMLLGVTLSDYELQTFKSPEKDTKLGIARDLYTICINRNANTGSRKFPEFSVLGIEGDEFESPVFSAATLRTYAVGFHG